MCIRDRIWYIVFMYAPMYGAQIAFRDFSPVLGITGSKWVGFKYFIQFFKSEYFGRLIKNTLQSFDIPRIVSVYPDRAGVRWWTKAWFNGKEEGEPSVEIEMNIFLRRLI